MLEALIVLFVVLWALGFFAFHVAGSFIHFLLVLAVIVLVVRLLQRPTVV